MKKFLILLLLAALIVLPVKIYSQSFVMINSGDTIVNSATEACSLKIAQPYTTITVHAYIVELSGTTGGTLTLQGTIDGTQWITVDTSALINEGLSVYTPTDVATQSKVWIMRDAPYLWLRLSYTGTGTMSAILNGYVLPRKYN